PGGPGGDRWGRARGGESAAEGHSPRRAAVRGRDRGLPALQRGSPPSAFESAPPRRAADARARARPPCPERRRRTLRRRLRTPRRGCRTRAILRIAALSAPPPPDG